MDFVFVPKYNVWILYFQRNIFKFHFDSNRKSVMEIKFTSKPYTDEDTLLIAA
jgi:hypothetical protein